jgi:hypothetical protein
MGRTELPGELVHGVVSDNDAILNVDHAIVGIEVFDGGAAASRITLPEDLLKVSIKKFRNTLGHY